MIGEAGRELGVLSGVLVLAVCSCTGTSSGDPGSPDAEKPPGLGLDGSVDGASSPDSSPSATAVAGAFAGVCSLSLLDVDAASCQGIAAYTQCAIDTCDLQACMTGACSDYGACLEDAGDPCAAGCAPCPTCTCQQTVAACAISQCQGALSCGATVPGGACDTLDACCDGQPAENRASCRQGASIARIRGDATCEQLLDLPPDSGLFYSCPPRDR